MDERKTAIIKAAFLFFVGSLMLSVSWLAWPDVLVDFGRELYVPWRMNEGEVLYRDIHYWNGPLSPHVNALLFRVFGESVMVLEAFNLVVIAAIAWLAWRIFSHGGETIAGLAASAVFLSVFAFGQYFWVGNFNFMAPYSHELTHGTLIAFASVYLWRKYHDNRGIANLLGVGFCTGLALLTKIEIALGVTAASAVGLVFTVWAEAPRVNRLGVMLGAFAAGVAVVLGPTTVYLSLGGSYGEALSGVFGSWVILATTDVKGGVFQRGVMGTDEPLANLVRMLRVASWYLVLVIPLGLNLVAARSRFRAWAGVVSFIVFAVLGVLLSDYVPWLEVFRPLPLWAGLVWVLLFLSFLIHRGDRERGESVVPMLAFATFAGVMLLKMLLNARVVHYGFALAMPATLLAVHALLVWLPRGVEKVSGYSGVFRAAALALVVITAAWYVNGSARVYSKKTYPVGSGLDRVMGFEPRYRLESMGVRMALAEIEDIMAPGETFAVLPEGVMLNYLSRRPNPTGYVNFVPSEIEMFGEAAMLNAFATHPPDYVLLAHKDTSDYGVRFFGRDYGRAIYSWVKANYRPVHLIGSPPLQSDEFGILFLEKK